MPGNQPYFLLVDLHADFADEFLDDRPPAGRIGLVEGVGGLLVAGLFMGEELA